MVINLAEMTSHGRPRKFSTEQLTAHIGKRLNHQISVPKCITGVEAK